jgi:homoserine acetyltransferase
MVPSRTVAEDGADSFKGWLYPPLGEMGFESWDAEDLLVMARMWQAGDVGACLADAGKDGYKRALEGIRCRVLVMPSRMDQYFLPEDSEIEVMHLKRCTLDVIETVWDILPVARMRRM